MNSFHHISSIETIHLPFYLGVYGTLKKGEVNHFLLGESRCVGSGLTPAAFQMYHVNYYPVIVPGKRAVEVEVYRITDASVALAIDTLEEWPDDYQKLQTTVLDLPVVLYYKADVEHASWRQVNACSWHSADFL